VAILLGWEYRVTTCTGCGVSGGAGWGEGSSSHKAGTSLKGVLVEGVEEKTGTERTLLGSGGWCSSCECVLLGRTGCGVSGGAGWGEGSSSHEAGTSWEEVLDEVVRREDGHRTHAVLGSGVWCSSSKCGIWTRETHWLW
jgi:hypothetical protein